MKGLKKNINRALALSKTSEYPRGMIAAVVTDRRGNVLAESTNLKKTHPFQKQFAEMAAIHSDNDKTIHRIYLHAEVAAIIQAMKVGIPHTIYVARSMSSKHCGLAKPCEICSLAIGSAGIKNIVYTNTADKLSFTVEEI